MQKMISLTIAHNNQPSDVQERPGKKTVNADLQGEMPRNQVENDNLQAQ